MGAAGGIDGLLDHLAGGEAAGEPAETGGAEGAADGAPDLTGDADGGAVGVEHQHGFDELAVEGLVEELVGVAVVGDRLADEAHRREGDRLGQFLAQGCGEVAHLVPAGDLAAVDPVPDLLRAVAGRAELGDLRFEGVEGRS